MMSEAELRALHARLVKAQTYARNLGINPRAMSELIHIKLLLEWLLGMETKHGTEFAAVIFRGLNNIEGLQRTRERSEQASRQ